MSDTNTDRGIEIENLARALARLAVAAGGVFWMIAAFAGPYVFRDSSMVESVRTALWPFLAAVVILVIGWAYEHFAAVLLMTAAAAVVVWGVLYGWELGVWILMTVVLIGPMTLAAMLFLLAARAESRRPVAPQPEFAAGAINAKAQLHVR